MLDTYSCAHVDSCSCRHFKTQLQARCRSFAGAAPLPRVTRQRRRSIDVQNAHLKCERLRHNAGAAVRATVLVPLRVDGRKECLRVTGLVPLLRDRPGADRRQRPLGCTLRASARRQRQGAAQVSGGGHPREAGTPSPVRGKPPRSCGRSAREKDKREGSNVSDGLLDQFAASCGVVGLRSSNLFHKGNLAKY